MGHASVGRIEAATLPVGVYSCMLTVCIAAIHPAVSMQPESARNTSQIKPERVSFRLTQFCGSYGRWCDVERKRAVVHVLIVMLSTFQSQATLLMPSASQVDVATFIFNSAVEFVRTFCCEMLVAFSGFHMPASAGAGLDSSCQSHPFYIYSLHCEVAIQLRFLFYPRLAPLWCR